MNSHSKTQTENIQKSSIDIDVFEGERFFSDRSSYIEGNLDDPKTIAVKSHCPLSHISTPLLIGQEKPKNAKWTGIYSLSNILSQELAKNKLITVNIDFKKRIIQGTAPLEINGQNFTLNAYFDDAGNVSELFDIDTDSLVSRDVCGKIYQNYVDLELYGVGSESILYLGGLIAYPPDE